MGNVGSSVFGTHGIKGQNISASPSIEFYHLFCNLQLIRRKLNHSSAPFKVFIVCITDTCACEALYFISISVRSQTNEELFMRMCEQRWKKLMKQTGGFHEFTGLVTAFLWFHREICGQLMN